MCFSVFVHSKIRAKLGLPPLTVDGGASNASEGGAAAAAAKSEDQDVHKPAINLMAKKKSDEMKAKLALIKEKRKINQKLKYGLVFDLILLCSYCFLIH